MNSTEVQYKISETNDYIICDVKTDLTYDLLNKIAQELHDFAQTHNIDRVFFDVRKIRNSENVKTNYNFVMTQISDPVNEHFKKIALLLNPLDTSHNDLVAFFKTRGQNLKDFFIEKDALEWLLTN